MKRSIEEPFLWRLMQIMNDASADWEEKEAKCLNI